MKRYSSRKLAYTSIMLALALIIGSIEHLLPPIVPALPFVRIGFSNIVTVFCVLVIGFPEAFAVAALKSILVPLFIGNPIMIVYSLSASIGSILVTTTLLKLKLSGIPIISIIGAIIHNLIQLTVASIMTSSPIVFGYTPILIITGAGAGLATGIVLFVLIKYLPEKLLNLNSKE